MEKQVENKPYGPSGQPVGKSQIYVLLVDYSGNPILDANGNQQVVAAQTVDGKIQVYASTQGPSGVDLFYLLEKIHYQLAVMNQVNLLANNISPEQIELNISEVL